MSPQFGWVEKLQRTARFQTVRGGYLVFFQNPFENHRYINLDTHRHRLTDQGVLVEIIQRPSVGFFQNPFENHRDINLDTHRHRLTDRSQRDWPASVGRNYTEAVCPGRFSRRKSVCLSVRPTVRAGSAGGLKRGTVASRTDRQTHYVNLIYNYNMCVRLSVRLTTVPRFNWLAEPARTVGFRHRKPARTVEFYKQKISHKKSFVPFAASCLKTKARTVEFCKQKIPHKKSFVPLAASCMKTKRRNL